MQERGAPEQETIYASLLAQWHQQGVQWWLHTSMPPGGSKWMVNQAPSCKGSRAPSVSVGGSAPWARP